MILEIQVVMAWSLATEDLSCSFSVRPFNIFNSTFQLFLEVTFFIGLDDQAKAKYMRLSTSKRLQLLAIVLHNIKIVKISKYLK